MKHIKNKTKLERTTGRRINSIDIMIFFLVIVFVLGMVLRFGVLDEIQHKAAEKNATLSFIIEGVSEGNFDYIGTGDKMFLSDSSEELGSIQSLNAPEPYSVYYKADDASILSLPSVDGKVNISGTLTVKGSLTDKGFLLNGTTYIAPNMNLYVNSSKISVSMLITNIEINEN